MEIALTVSTVASQITVAATGAVSYAFPFIGVSASDIIVIYTNTSGTSNTLTSGSYAVSINAPVTGQTWGQGGTINPVVPSSLPSGSLTIVRVLPLTQEEEISNQGNQYPIVTEQALDILCMEIQQVAARTGQYRGTWITNTVYNFGDIVVDGVSGNNSTNWYLCANANTSGTWSTDLANGDWVIILNIQAISNPGVVAAGGDLTGNFPNPTIAKIQGTAIAGVTGTGNVIMTTGLASVLSAYLTLVAAAATYAPINSPTFTGTPLLTTTPAAGDNSQKVIDSAYVDRGSSGASMVLLATATASSSATVDFINIPSGYDQYIVRISSAIPATNSVTFGMRYTENNGSSYLASNYAWAANKCGSNATAAGTGSGSDSSIALSSAASVVNNISGVSAQITLMNLSSSSLQKMCLFQTWFNDGAYEISNGSGTYGGDTNVVNGVRFLFSSGNIASGKFALYGVRNS